VLLDHECDLAAARRAATQSAASGDGDGAPRDTHRYFSFLTHAARDIEFGAAEAAERTVFEVRYDLSHKEWLP